MIIQYRSFLCAVICLLASSGQLCRADVLNRTGWVATASSSDSGAPPSNALDGNINTRWSTGQLQANGQWFQVDMGAGTPPTFSKITLDAGSSSGDYPRGYRVNVSSDGVNWGNSVAAGNGNSSVTTITFTPQKARYIRVTQTGSAGIWWSIHEFTVDGTSAPPPPTGVTLSSANGQNVVSWAAVPQALSYAVKRSTSYGGPYTVLASNLTALNYTDSSAVSGTIYFYVVSASNAYGEGANSSQATCGWRVIIPSLNTNEIVVAATTPQEYGAKGDGVTDDSAAFQSAMNAVYNPGKSGGGVVFVPAGQYAFYTNITIPAGVTLHGDWTDWTKGSTGLIGTTFRVCFGAGQSTNTPFIFLNGSTALRDVNIWYPGQNPANIVSYPFTIGVSGDCVVQNVVLVNSYQGIQVAPPTSGGKGILSTIIGSPLAKGIDLDGIADICHTEDIRFTPDVWPASLLPNAPAKDGPHAAWMRANGTGLRLLRVDGELSMDTFISGYNVGIEANSGATGEPGATFYSGAISNCGTALLAEEMPGALGLVLSGLTLDGDVAVKRTHAGTDANVQFDRCQIIGRSGAAVSATGSGWHSWMQFQNCTISNALQLNKGVFNLVNCTLSGATQCVMSASATRAAFVGCTFNSPTNIVNWGHAGNLIIDARASAPTAMPVVQWTNVVNDYLSRKPAKTDLYIATAPAWGAKGDGSTDDSTAVQKALNAAGANGGGIVFLPGGKYKLNAGLDVPSGVELRGTFEMRHRTWPGPDGKAKGTVLQPYGGQGTTNGTPAIALEANSGLVGVTISYETQSSNCFAFPPTIQGRGGNVYAIGVVCPNPYYYVDLDTFTCTNHLFYMVDGWPLKTGFNIGNGSSGAVVDCHGNATYWIDNYDSPSQLNSSMQHTVLDFASHNAEMFVIGDCNELLVKNFNILENTFVRFRSENGKGPNATLIGDYCDATIRGVVLDCMAPSTINAVNTPMCVFNFNNDDDLAQSTVGVLSTTNFQGTARFFNTILFAGPYWDFVVNGGDVGLELVHMDQAFLGSSVNGGAFHLVNMSANVTGKGSSSSYPSYYPAYNVAFGPKAGSVGTTSEFIGAYNYGGCSFSNGNSANALNAWADYALAAYPGAPMGLMAAASSGQVKLSWQPVAGAISYNVKRGTANGGPYALAASVAATNYVDTDLTAGATYYYVVSTVSAFGESGDSDPICSRDVLLSRASWTATSSGGEPPANAIDGSASTRWSTGAYQTNGQWFQVDIGSAKTIFKLVLDATASANDYPRGYRVNLSSDGITWGDPVASGVGSAVTIITFPALTARYIRITQTGAAPGNWWSIHEFNVYGTPPSTPTGLAAAAAANQLTLTWTPSSQATRYTIKRSPNNSGPYTVIGTSTTTNCTISNLLIGNACYVISASNTVGESGDSIPVIATALAGSITAQPLTTGEYAIATTVLTGQTCILEMSTNLAAWTPILTNTAQWNGSVILTDVPGASNASRFYRVRYE